MLIELHGNNGDPLYLRADTVLNVNPSDDAEFPRCLSAVETDNWIWFVNETPTEVARLVNAAIREEAAL